MNCKEEHVDALNTIICNMIRDSVLEWRGESISIPVWSSTCHAHSTAYSARFPTDLARSRAGVKL
jgi:hypothetical protein